MEGELKNYAENAVAKDRLNTLASIVFNKADINYKGTDLDIDEPVRGLLKAWFPETYSETFQARLNAKQKEENTNE